MTITINGRTFDVTINPATTQREGSDLFREIARSVFKGADKSIAMDFIGDLVYGDKTRDHLLADYFGEDPVEDGDLVTFCSEISWQWEHHMFPTRTAEIPKDDEPSEPEAEIDNDILFEDLDEQIPDISAIDPIMAETFLKEKGLYDEFRLWEKYQSLWSHDLETGMHFEDVGKDFYAHWVFRTDRHSLTISFGNWYTEDIFLSEANAKKLVYEIWSNPDDYTILGRKAEGGLLFKLSTTSVWETDRWEFDPGLYQLIKKLGV